MTKLCPRGKAAAKRKFKVYPSAYANAYASKICAGKIKDPSGKKRKDWGPKKAKTGDIMESEEDVRFKGFKTKYGDRQSAADRAVARKLLKRQEELINFQMREKLRKKDKNIPLKTIGKGASNKGSEKLDKMLSVDNVKQLMDAMPKYNVGGHNVMGSPVSVDVDGDTLSNPSASDYYKDLL